MPDRFPPPWTVRATDAAFVVTDTAGCPLAYIYFGGGVAVGTGAERLTKDQARRIAANIAKLPVLLAYVGAPSPTALKLDRFRGKS